MKPVEINELSIGGDNPIALIAGPCVIESAERTLAIGRAIKDIAVRLGIPYIFKASYDKANRSSFNSFRGPGLTDGLAVLAAIKEELAVPVLSDIHAVDQIEPAAAVLDILQIPAFLSRQTDLVYQAGASGKAVNVKKGQFLAPADMKNVINKILEAGNEKNIAYRTGNNLWL